ncbi:MAG TPA: lytic transglycosylase domain-containing protein [Candidatus Baltobacteraceae bacterium]|nr:lytic transglycosylase domain-containing protein [Candidatus Baltobacteraceae bacterium]
MDIYSDIAAVNRRIAELTGQTYAPAVPQTAAAGGGSFASMVSSAMSPQDNAPLQPTQGPNVIPPPQIESLIGSNAGQYGVDPALVKAIVANESGFDANATSPTGAQGLMQLEPETASSLGVDNAYDPAQNISGGTRYIRSLLERFHGDVRLAVAAYNAGPGAVEKYGGVPPYAETQAYVRNVLGDYAKYRSQ